MTEAARSLSAFAAQGLLLTGFILAVGRRLGTRMNATPWLTPAVAAAGVAALGYVAFWTYFASPILGRAFSWLVLAGAAGTLSPPRARLVGPPSEWGRPLLLAAVIGAGAIALTCLYGGNLFSFLAANRFLA